MGIMRKKAGMLGFLGMMLATRALQPHSGGSATSASVADLLRLGRRRDEKIRAMYPERCIRNGMSRFVIDGNEVYALNRNNALRKMGKEYKKKKKAPKYSNEYFPFSGESQFEMYRKISKNSSRP